MTEKEAKEIGAYYYKDYKSIIVLSNKSIFLNAEFEIVSDLAKKNNLELFIIKGHEDRGDKKVSKRKI